MKTDIGHNGGPPLDDGSLIGSPTDEVGVENLRWFARLDGWDGMALDAPGEALRKHVAAHLGAGATEPLVAEGVRRLARVIEVEARIGPRLECPRMVLRVALCGIGLVPVREPEMPGDELLDQWLTALLAAAQTAGGHAS